MMLTRFSWAVLLFWIILHSVTCLVGMWHHLSMLISSLEMSREHPDPPVKSRLYATAAQLEGGLEMIWRAMLILTIPLLYVLRLFWRLKECEERIGRLEAGGSGANRADN